MWSGDQLTIGLCACIAVKAARVASLVIRSSLTLSGHVAYTVFGNWLCSCCQSLCMPFASILVAWINLLLLVLQFMIKNVYLYMFFFAPVYFWHCLLYLRAINTQNTKKQRVVAFIAFFYRFTSLVVIYHSWAARDLKNRGINLVSQRFALFVSRSLYSCASFPSYHFALPATRPNGLRSTLLNQPLC